MDVEFSVKIGEEQVTGKLSWLQSDVIAEALLETEQAGVEKAEIMAEMLTWCACGYCEASENKARRTFGHYARAEFMAAQEGGEMLEKAFNECKKRWGEMRSVGPQTSDGTGREAERTRTGLGKWLENCQDYDIDARVGALGVDVTVGPPVSRCGRNWERLAEMGYVGLYRKEGSDDLDGNRSGNA